MTDQPVLSPVEEKIVADMEARRKAAEPPTMTLSRSFLDRMASATVDPHAPLPVQEEPSSAEPLVIFRP